MTPDIYRIWLKNSVVDVNNPPDFSHLDNLYNRLIENIRGENYFSFMKMGDGDILPYFLHPIIHTTMSQDDMKIFSKTLHPFIEHKISTNDPKIILGIENNTPFFDAERFVDNKWPAEKILDLFERLKHTDSLKNNCMVFSYIYAKEGLGRLFDCLSDKNVIMVGPEYLNRINIESKSIKYVVTPLRNSWRIQEDIEKDLDQKISSTKNPIIIYACSITGKMALVKMYFKYSEITQIDIGANLDPYAGEGCRPWHPKKHKIMNHKGKFEYMKFDNRREGYKRAIEGIKSMDFTKDELIEDFPRFSGHMTIGRYLTLYELYKKTEGIAGHIAEVGTYKGSSLLWFTKLLQIYEPEALTQVHGFDWFQGTGDDDVELKIEKGSYKSSYEELQDLIKVQNLQNNCFVHKLNVVTELEKFFDENKHLYFKVVFLDAGFYNVVKKSIEVLWPRLNPGGVLILDQFGHDLSPGEAMAVKEMLPGEKIQTVPNSWMPNAYIIKK